MSEEPSFITSDSDQTITKTGKMPVFFCNMPVSRLTAKKLFLIYIPVIIPMTADAAMKAIGWIFLRGVYLIQTKAMAASMIACQ